MISGRRGSTASAPIDATGSSSNTGKNVVPAFTVFHRPPEAVPIYNTSGFLGSAAIAVTLPEGPAGPIFLGLMPWNRLMSTFWPGRFKEKNINTNMAGKIFLSI